MFKTSGFQVDSWLRPGARAQGVFADAKLGGARENALAVEMIGAQCLSGARVVDLTFHLPRPAAWWAVVRAWFRSRLVFIAVFKLARIRCRYVPTCTCASSSDLTDDGAKGPPYFVKLGLIEHFGIAFNETDKSKKARRVFFALFA